MSATQRRLPEIYMRVKDHTQLQKLLVIQQRSARHLAAEVGYTSHSYVQRILRGEISTVTPEKAARIARYFGVGVDDLFVARLSSDSGQTSERRSA